MSGSGRLRAVACAVTALWLLPASAWAGVIDFTDGACHDLTLCERTITGGAEDGTLATFGAPTVEVGTNDFFNLDQGLALGSGSLGYRWQLRFDNPVLWTGGVLGWASDNRGFSVTGGNVAVGNLLFGQAAGAYTLADAISFEPGVDYTFTANNQCFRSNTACGGLVFETMVFGYPAAPVPLPATIWLLAGALVGLGVARRRRG